MGCEFRHGFFRLLGMLAELTELHRVIPSYREGSPTLVTIEIGD